MATKEITKRQPQYPEPMLEPELISESGEQPQEGGQVVARVALLWEHRQWLLRRAAVAFAASTLIVFLIPVRYTSTTRLMPPDQPGQGISSMLAAVGRATGDIGIGGNFGMKTTGDLFVGVLQSRSVADQLIDKFDLRKLYGVKRYQDARIALAARTEIFPDRKSGIITLTITDRDPERAAAMGREYVDALNRIVITLNTSSAHKERVFLEERLGQVQGDLEQAEKDFSQFASKNTAIDVKEQGRAMIGAAAELEGQLIAAETELEGLRQIYTPNNVRVRSVQARIDEYKRQMQRLGGKTGEDSKGDSSQNGSASDQAADPYPSIRQLPLLNVEWSDLYRRTKVQEVVLETLTKQYELAKVEEAREVPSVKVLDPADVPERKSYPPRTILVGSATVLVFILSCGWILAYARWQEIDPTDPGKMLSERIFESVRASVSRLTDRVARKSRDKDRDFS